MTYDLNKKIYKAIRARRVTDIDDRCIKGGGVASVNF